MPLGLALLLAVIGAAALVFSVLNKGKKKLRIAVGIAGAIILMAVLMYIILTFIFINSV